MIAKNKILISINNLSDIEKYKKIGITNFLFKVDNFSLHQTFKLTDIKKCKENIYLYFDKILDTKTIEEFKTIIQDLSFAKGILFDDVGIYQVLKNTNLPLIWAQNHFVINTRTINLWLEKTTSALLSNELTKEEIITILNNTTKPLILNVFGYNLAMYSRRYLLSSYKDATDIKISNNSILKINEKIGFITTETKEGTLFYYHRPFNYIPYLNAIDDNKILLYYIDSTYSSVEDIENLLDGNYLELKSEEQFFEEKSIYKLED